MATQTLEVIVFPGGFNWPIWAAQKIGAFEGNGLAINLTNTPNSVEQLTGLIDDRYHIGMTAIDNIVAYNEGQGAAETQNTSDLFAFMGGDNGFLQLVVQGDVNDYADLKGREISVDALTTGYAFVLLKMLELGGLSRDDYEIVQAGGALQRFEAMKEGAHAATLLVTPFEILGGFSGLNVLQSGIDVIRPYQGLVGGARRSWAADNQDALVGYIKAYLSGLDWLYAPENRDEALQILVDNIPQMTPELAATISEKLLNPVDGFARAAKIDLAGVRTVLNLRSEFGDPQKDLADSDAYIDLTFYDKAING